MQAPRGPPEDPSGGFEHGGWLVSLADAEMGACMDETLAPAEAFLLGRFTDQTFAITSAGTVIAVYAFDGRPSCGSFALEDEGVEAGFGLGGGAGGAGAGGGMGAKAQQPPLAAPGHTPHPS